MPRPDTTIDVTDAKKRDVCTTVLSFQTLEHVDEPRVKTKTSPQFLMRDLLAEASRSDKRKARWRPWSPTCAKGKVRWCAMADSSGRSARARPAWSAATRLTTTRTNWVDCWAVDFDYGSRKEIVKQPRSLAMQASLVAPSQGKLVEWEDWRTGGYIFQNEWQSFRTRQDRKLELTSVAHVYAQPGRYQVAVKVIDIFGNDTMTIVPVSVG